VERLARREQRLAQRHAAGSDEEALVEDPGELDGELVLDEGRGADVVAHFDVEELIGQAGEQARLAVRPAPRVFGRRRGQTGQARVGDDERRRLLEQRGLACGERAVGEDPSGTAGILHVVVGMAGVVNEVELAREQRAQDLEALRGSDAWPTARGARIDAAPDERQSYGHSTSSYVSSSSSSATYEPCDELVKTSTSPFLARFSRLSMPVSIVFFVASASVMSLTSELGKSKCSRSSAAQARASFTQPFRSAPSYG
jgi:hypothetical protein